MKTKSIRTFRFTSSGCKRSGFTFLEMIIVVALAVMTLSAVYATLYFSSRSAAYARVDIIKKQELMKQFHRIRRQLINIYTNDRGPILLGQKTQKERCNELYFVTTTMENNQGIGEVGYKIIEDYDGNRYLAYTEFPYPREENRFAPNNLNSQMDKWRPCSMLIKEFLVEYKKDKNDIDWLEEWTDDGAPERIRITFYYKDQEDDEKLTPYSFIVVPGIKTSF